MGVKNSGGFRFIGSVSAPKYVVLFSTGDDLYWRDELDRETGTYLYYGDNKKPGTELEDTNLGGNKVLSLSFQRANSHLIDERKTIPPFFIFTKDEGWNVRFLGLAVPGVKDMSPRDWLVAVWGNRIEGGRFLNYKSYFTILDTQKGCKANPTSASIELAWLNDLIDDKGYESIYAPHSWIKYIETSMITPLTTVKERQFKTKDLQLPSKSNEIELLDYLHRYYIDKSRGYDFEKFAIHVVKRIDSQIIDLVGTRKTKDGGFDGIGKYRIFNNVENSNLVEFYLEAKCYRRDRGVGVKEMARLISRIKNRQFGILVTTSYIDKQAYEEVLMDGHPIVLVTGKDLTKYLVENCEIQNTIQLESWIITNNL